MAETRGSGGYFAERWREKAQRSRKCWERGEQKSKRDAGFRLEPVVGCYTAVSGGARKEIRGENLFVNSIAVYRNCRASEEEGFSTANGRQLKSKGGKKDSSA